MMFTTASVRSESMSTSRIPYKASADKEMKEKEGGKEGGREGGREGKREEREG